jgi:translation elongation factor EF-1alpha
LLPLLFRYDEIVKGLTPFLKQCGYNPKKDLTFIPISALHGHNVKQRVTSDVSRGVKIIFWTFLCASRCCVLEAGVRWYAFWCSVTALAYLLLAAAASGVWQYDGITC